jgi:hypothetical protein
MNAYETVSNKQQNPLISGFVVYNIAIFYEYGHVSKLVIAIVKTVK